MPIHITMNQGFELRNAVYLIDAVASFVVIPLALVSFAWLGRRDIMRALIGFAALAMLLILATEILQSVLFHLENQPNRLTLPITFTIQALGATAGVSAQLAATLVAIVGAFALVLSARRRAWRWFAALAVFALLAALAQSVTGSAHTLFRNAIPAAIATNFLGEQLALCFVTALLPVAAWLYAARASAFDRPLIADKTAPSQLG